MNIYTLNVGQGQFVVVTGDTQAIIIDTYIPLNPTNDIIHVKAALAKILQGKELVGLMVTGFDADHFNEVGMRIVLNKYRPNWIMYPKYFKDTRTADSCFEVIKFFEKEKKFQRWPVNLEENNKRLYKTLSTEFTIEAFSPHSEDMNSSNNCSLVCKIKEISTGKTYLVTGDTESERWLSVARIFGSSITADILAAPHHGSKNGISEAAIKLVKPHTVLISAGVDNQYGHPDKEATSLFKQYAQNYHATCYGGGQSLRTEVTQSGIKTYKFIAQN
jgi:beta-lactamase superfamily II metal-dependent hydrolase